MSKADYVTTANTPQKIYKHWADVINQWNKQKPNEGEIAEAEKKAAAEAKKIEAAQRREEEAEAKRIAEEEKARRIADRNKKIDIRLRGRTTEEIMRLRTQFELSCNSVVRASLDKGYESAFVKPARYSFLFDLLSKQ